MAYPFIEWPSFGDLRQRLLDEFGCTYDRVGTINGADTWCLARVVDGENRRYGVMYQDHERLAPSVVRSICARLKVDPKAFGLTLG